MTYEVAGKRVLLVEDDVVSRSALQTVLEFEGFVVREAGDGSEGIQIVDSFCPHAIVLDLVLPRLNGFDTARLLKSRPETAEIPLIAVTASWLGSDGERLARIGFETAIRKPFPAIRLVDELRRILKHNFTTPAVMHPPVTT